MDQLRLIKSETDALVHAYELGTLLAWDAGRVDGRFHQTRLYRTRSGGYAIEHKTGDRGSTPEFKRVPDGEARSVFDRLRIHNVDPELAFQVEP